LPNIWGGMLEKTVKITFIFESEKRLNWEGYVNYLIFAHYFKLIYILLRNNKELLERILKDSLDNKEDYHKLGKYLHHDIMGYIRRHGYLSFLPFTPLPFYKELCEKFMTKIPEKPIIDYKCIERIENNKIIFEFEGEEECLRCLMYLKDSSIDESIKVIKSEEMVVKILEILLYILHNLL